MLSSGSTFGKYEIDSILGQGGFGVVYKAHEKPGGRVVALKLLNEELASSADYREKLAKEAKLNSSVDSPYVVKVWEYDEIDKMQFIAMEYVSGDDLRTAVDRLGFEEKLDLVAKIGEGIEAAHKSGLVHRDLKPENIKLDENGSPKILDFGLAQDVSSDTVDDQGNIEGSLYYFSPEQLSGETVTASSDIFSYGTLVYEMCVGRRPFEDVYQDAIMYSILHEDPDPPTEINEDLPLWFDELIGRLLAKAPSERFADLSEALEFLRQSRETGLTPGKTWERPRQTVTVVDLKNRSGDESWDYFAEGFTDDIVKELSRRTDLIVNAEPATSHQRDIRKTFEKCRSDFVIVGSMMKWKEKIRLSLSIYGDGGDELMWDSSYSEDTDKLFDLLSNAANEASAKLAEATDSTQLSVDEDFQPDVTAYDFYLKGKAYYQTNKPENLELAEQMFNSALEVDPNYALAHSGLADLYAFMYMAFIDRSPERIAKAMEKAQEAKAINKKLQEAHRSIARCYMFTGEFDKAEKSLLKTIDLHPKYAIGYRTLGWLKHTQGDITAALKWARKALELSPTDLETLLLISLINMNQGKFTLAISTLQRALQLGPDYGRAYYNLGQAYLALGVIEPAIENFEKAARYEGDPNCFNDCGYLYLIQNNYDKARQKFEESIEHNFFPFVSKYLMGLAELLTSGADDAQSYFRESADMISSEFDLTLPENRPVRIYYAMALAGAGETESARTLLKEIETISTMGGDALYFIARGYALLGDNVKANEVLNNAIESTSGSTLSRNPTRKEADLDPHFSLYSGTEN